MPSTKTTSSQKPGYPLSCTVMAKPTAADQKPGYPLSCSVMKQPAQKPGYPLSCTVIYRQHMAKRSLSNNKLEEDGDDMARRGFIGLFTFVFTWL
ncbi:hypothetical protein FSHL1_001574 [Fusarium sambucinum]